LYDVCVYMGERERQKTKKAFLFLQVIAWD
jgi:hypothetical protein